ncbi:MAG: hypothetical protein WD342_18275 [Verrucomicrobiales bacterium]
MKLMYWMKMRTIAISRATLLCLFCTTLIFVGASLARAQDSQRRSLEELNTLFESRNSELMAPITTLETGYAAQLNRLLDQVTESGKLEDALLVKNEMENFRSGGEEGKKDLFPELERLRDIYSTEHEKRMEGIRAERLKLMAAYKASLEEMQTRLTQEKKLEDAVEVKSAIEKVDATMKEIEEKIDSSPVGARTQFRVGSPSESLTTEGGAGSLASVEVADAEFRDLEVGAECFSDAEYTFANVPESLKGTKFSVQGKHSHTLNFTVEKGGLVFIAVSNRFSEKSGSGGDWEKSALDEKGLRRLGWRYLREFDELETDASGNALVFYKECESGETHSIRTEKYLPPFLLRR